MRFGRPTAVAEFATTAMELFRASLECINLFHLPDHVHQTG